MPTVTPHIVVRDAGGAADWYRQAQQSQEPAAFRTLTRSQINTYCRQARDKDIVWAVE